MALYFKKCACRYVYVALWHIVLLRTVAHRVIAHCGTLCYCALWHIVLRWCHLKAQGHSCPPVSRVTTPGPDH